MHETKTRVRKTPKELAEFYKSRLDSVKKKQRTLATVSKIVLGAKLSTLALQDREVGERFLRSIANREPERDRDHKIIAEFAADVVKAHPGLEMPPLSPPLPPVERAKRG